MANTGTQAQNMIMIGHAEMLIQVRAAVLEDVRREIEHRHTAHRRELHIQVRQAHAAEHAEREAAERRRVRTKALGHLVIILLGGLIAWVVTRLGGSDLVAIATGLVPPATQELFDWAKKL